MVLSESHLLRKKGGSLPFHLPAASLSVAYGEPEEESLDESLRTFEFRTKSEKRVLGLIFRLVIKVTRSDHVNCGLLLLVTGTEIGINAHATRQWTKRVWK